MAKDILFTKSFLDDIADALPGAKVTREAGVIVSIEHKTPDMIEVDPFLEKPAWPKTIIRTGGHSHGKTTELAKTIAQELAEKIPVGHEIQDIQVDPYAPKDVAVVSVKTGRGGAREGAGRKPDPDKRAILSCRVKQPTLRLLKETAEETGTGLGEVLDFIVADYKRRTDSE